VPLFFYVLCFLILEFQIDAHVRYIWEWMVLLGRNHVKHMWREFSSCRYSIFMFGGNVHLLHSMCSFWNFWTTIRKQTDRAEQDNKSRGRSKSVEGCVHYMLHSPSHTFLFAFKSYGVGSIIQLTATFVDGFSCLLRFRIDLQRLWVLLGT